MVQPGERGALDEWLQEVRNAASVAAGSVQLYRSGDLSDRDQDEAVRAMEHRALDRLAALLLEDARAVQLGPESDVATR